MRRIPVSLSISYFTVSVGTISMYVVTTRGASVAHGDAVPGVGPEHVPGHGGRYPAAEAL